jgi:CheY-like chemotaxis protein
MKRLLLVEDQAKDMLNAATVAESLGFDKVEAYNTVRGAMSYLDKGLSGDGPLPDAIVLDLDLGPESGYELLRFWHGTGALSRIPVMVWSVVEQQREVCELFKVKSFVSKWEGSGAFRQALGELVTPSHAG